MIHTADFKPAWWLPGPHLQTLWPVLVRRQPRPSLRRERLELPDGDFLDLDWAQGNEGPIIVILHGLEGSSQSGYAQGLLHTVAARGWRGVVLHFRGCSGEPNRLAPSYNAGHTHDLAYVIACLCHREPLVPLACVGYSLGGNVLLKWLGEVGREAPVQAAVAVSVPFLLELATRRLGQGFSRLYQAYLLYHLRASYRGKRHLQAQLPVPIEDMARLKDFYRFDDQVTAPLHGYVDAHDYYTRASCRPYLKAIRVPTLILHALDDPFMLPEAVPTAAELADSVILELSLHGGHVGFVTGPSPWRAVYWLERRIPLFLAERL
jgi:predicted alpha/beta-fold hydrolase